jgi:hypothetical protein
MADDFDLTAALEDDATPAGLRKWAETVQKTNKKLADELADIRKAERRNTVTGALKTLGVNERVATFYPSDSDASAEAIAKWLKDNEGVFTVLPADNAGGDGNASPTLTDHSPIAADAVAAMRMIQDATPVTGGGTPTILERAAEIDKLGMRTAEDRAKLDGFELELQQMARAQQSQYVNSMRT